MPRPELEAFIKLFADDTQLRASFGALKAEAQKAGTDISKAFEVAGGRARRFGAELAGGGARGGGILGGGGIGGAGAVGGAGRILGLGRFGMLGRLASAHPLAAAFTAAAVAAGAYISKISEVMDAENALAAARRSGDPAAVAAIMAKNAEEMGRLGDNATAALVPVTKAGHEIRTVVGQFRLFREELFGKGIVELRKEAEETAKAGTLLWRVFGAPQLAIAGLKRSAEEMAANAQVAMKAAESTAEYSAAVDQLIASKERELDATKQGIEQEVNKIRLDLANGKITEAEATDRVADAKEREAEADRKFARERGQIEQDRRREIAERQALETEAAARIIALKGQERDAIVEAVGQIVETEAAANLSLEKTFAARAAVQEEQTRNSLASLEAEVSARRRAIEQRLEGAIGQDRVKLERDLTAAIQEEATKRTSIEAKASAERLKLLRDAQREQAALADRLAAIQDVLGQRTLREEVARQAAIAQGAQAGSQIQLKALEQVAQKVAQLHQQAQAFLSQALGAADALARKAGIEPSAFVSTASLAQAAAEQTRQLEEAQRTFTSGGAIKREDFQALMGGELKALLEQRRAGFAAGGEGALGGFAAQFAQAFTPPEDLFKAAIGPRMTEGWDDLLASATASFAELEKLIAASWDRIVAKTQDGTSRLATSITRMVEDNIARALADAERRS